MYFDHKIICFVKGRFAFRPVEEEGDSPIFANFRDSSYFGILSKVCLKDWLDDQAESGKNQFFGPRVVSKVSKLSNIHISRTTGRRKFVDNSKWPQDMIYYGWFKMCIPLR